MKTKLDRHHITEYSPRDELKELLEEALLTATKAASCLNGSYLNSVAHDDDFPHQPDEYKMPIVTRISMYGVFKSEINSILSEIVRFDRDEPEIEKQNVGDS